MRTKIQTKTHAHTTVYPLFRLHARARAHNNKTDGARSRSPWFKFNYYATEPRTHARSAAAVVVVALFARRTDAHTHNARTHARTQWHEFARRWRPRDIGQYLSVCAHALCTRTRRVVCVHVVQTFEPERNMIRMRVLLYFSRDMFWVREEERGKNCCSLLSGISRSRLYCSVNVFNNNQRQSSHAHSNRLCSAVA